MDTLYQNDDTRKNDDNLTFNQYMRGFNNFLLGKIGFQADDLADYDYQSAWIGCESYYDLGCEVLEYDGTADMLGIDACEMLG